MLSLLIACASETQLVSEPPALPDAWQPDGDCGPWWPYEREGLELVYEGFDEQGEELRYTEVVGAPGVYQGVSAYPVHVTIPRGWNTLWVACDQGSAWSLGWGDSAPDCLDTSSTASGLFAVPTAPGRFWSAFDASWRFESRWDVRFWIGTCDDLVLVEGWSALELDVGKGETDPAFPTRGGTFQAQELVVGGESQWIGAGIGWLVASTGGAYAGLSSGGPPFTSAAWVELVEVIEP